MYANNGADITVDGTAITSNVGAISAGLYVNQSSLLTLVDAVVEGNGDPLTSIGGGALVSGGSTLDAANTGWGADPDDNLPHDVHVNASGLSYAGYEAGESFSCDEQSCSPVP